MASTHDPVILEARFDAGAIIRYHWMGLLPYCLLIVTIPLVIVAAIVYALVLHRMVANWSATLTSRTLQVKKGIFIKVEKTIPLEKITDLSLAQGPIMRLAGIKRLSVETAGQSSAAGAALVTLLGVVDTEGFRERVLAQRDRVPGVEVPAAARLAGAVSSAPGDLGEITEILRRIEQGIERLVDRDGRGS